FLAAGQATLDNRAWTTRAGRSPREEEAGNEGAAWVDALREGRPAVHDEQDGRHRLDCREEWFADARRELVVPVFREGEIVALLGVSGKPFAYGSRDVEAVQRLADL